MPAQTDFKPIGIAVLTISDSRTLETDTSGQLLASRIEAAGHVFKGRQIIIDEISDIQATVKTLAADPKVQAVITTGGTGLTGRDHTPEALLPLFDKVIDGFSVMFHMISHSSIGMSTLQSRALAGIVDGTYVFALPGSGGAVKDGWDKVIGPQLDSRTSPCNMVTIIPRLQEEA